MGRIIKWFVFHVTLFLEITGEFNNHPKEDL
jgi:hypothetical protein